MSLAFIIYLIDTLDVSRGMGLIAIILIIVWVLGFIFCLLAKIDDSLSEGEKKSVNEMYSVHAKPLKVLAVILTITSLLLPTKDTAYKMLAAYGVESVASNPKVQELAGTSLKVLDKAMKDYLGDEKPIENKETK